MEVIIKKMNKELASTIVKWKYSKPYERYDFIVDDLEELLDGSYYGVIDGSEGLIGYYCFGQSARVPVDRQKNAYDETDVIDLGLGMRPDLCGKGLGRLFTEQGIIVAYKYFNKKNIRLTVASFNSRAIKVYERVGFYATQSFDRKEKFGVTKFIVMIYSAERS